MTQAAVNARGVAFMLGAMAAFATSDFLVKLATRLMPVSEIMALRGLIAVSMIGAVLARGGYGSAGAALRSPMAVLRGVIESGVSLTIMAGLSSLPLGDCAAIPQAAPLLITLYMVATRAESFDPVRMAMIVVGFVGVAMVARPSGAFQPATLLLIAAAFLIAARDLVTRRIPRHVSSLAATLVTTMGTTVLGASLSSVQPWILPDARGFLLLGAAAAAVTLGNLCAIAAFREAEPSVVAPFRYTIVVYALLIGFVVWGDLPDPIAGLGIALIVGAGVVSILREKVRARVEKVAQIQP